MLATNVLLSEHETIVWLDSVDGHRQAKAEATFIAILVGTLGSVHSRMQVKVSGSFAAPIYVIVMLLALGSSLAVKAHTPDDDDNPAELNRRIAELCGEDKFKEAIPLAEKLVVLTKRAKGDEDPDTASSLNSLAGLYGVTGDYAKAEPLCKEALQIRQKVLGPRIIPIRQKASTIWG